MAGPLSLVDDGGGEFADERARKLRLAYEVLTGSGGSAPGMMGKAMAGLRDMTAGATPPPQVLRMPEQALGAVGDPEPSIDDKVKFANDVAAKLKRSVYETGRVPTDIAEHGRKLVEGLPKPEAKVEFPGLPPLPKPQMPKIPARRVVVGKAASVKAPRTAVLEEAAVPAKIAEIGGEAPKPAPDSLHPAIRALLGSAGVGPADPGLERAQETASDSRLMAALTRAGGAAIGRGQGAAYDAMDEAADVPIRDYQQRRAEQDARSKAAIDAQDRTRRYTREDLEMQGLQRAEAEAVAEEDPNSQQSAMARQIITKMVPELGKRAEMQTATAAQIKRQLPWAKEILEEQLRRMQMGAGADERRLRREEMRERQNFMRQERLGERYVGGLDFADGVIPSKSSAGEMQKSVSAVRNILGDLEQMQDVYTRKGAEFGFGGDRATSEGAKQNILLKLKELENLGVLQKIDVEAMSKVIPDTNSLRGALDSSGTTKSFENFNRQLREAIAAGAETRGYRVVDPRLQLGGTGGSGAAGPGLSPEKKTRLEELRRKKAEGSLR